MKNHRLPRTVITIFLDENLQWCNQRTLSFTVCFRKAITSVITRHKRYLLSQTKPGIEIISSCIIFFPLFLWLLHMLLCDWFFFQLDSFSHWTIYTYMYVSTLFTREIIVVNLIRFLLVFLASFISFEVSIELYRVSFRCWKMNFDREILLANIIVSIFMTTLIRKLWIFQMKRRAMIKLFRYLYRNIWLFVCYRDRYIWCTKAVQLLQNFVGSKSLHLKEGISIFSAKIWIRRGGLCLVYNEVKIKMRSSLIFFKITSWIFRYLDHAYDEYWYIIITKKTNTYKNIYIYRYIY